MQSLFKRLFLGQTCLVMCLGYVQRGCGSEVGGGQKRSDTSLRRSLLQQEPHRNHTVRERRRKGGEEVEMSGLGELGPDTHEHSWGGGGPGGGGGGPGAVMVMQIQDQRAGQDHMSGPGGGGRGPSGGRVGFPMCVHVHRHACWCFSAPGQMIISGGSKQHLSATAISQRSSPWSPVVRDH